MTPKQFIAFVAVPAVGLTLAFATVDTLRTTTVEAAEAAVTQVAFGGHQGWGRGRHGRGLAHLCSDRRDERIDDAIGFIEDFVDFTPPQTAAWNDLTKAVRESSATIGEACGDLGDVDADGNAPARLALIESLATTGLDVLKRVRPPFDAFYQTLDEDQQKRLDKLFNRGHRH
jgi:hypothetical protein